MGTLEQIMRILFSSTFLADKLTIVWHAGEPLSLPPRFYRQALALIQQYNTQGINVTNSIQTNATLIDQEWCDLFKEHDLHIGVSLDGPQYLHDANRVDRNGHGTFDLVMRGVNLLKANGIPFTVIAVVTQKTLSYPDEFWHFFNTLRPVRLGMNIEETEGVNIESSLLGVETIAAYKKFFRRLLFLSQQDPNPIVVREIEVQLERVKHGTLRVRSQTNVPGTIFSFDARGNISTFSPELLTTAHSTYENFIFGNVFENRLEDIFRQQKFLQVNMEIQHGVNRCSQECEYFMFCGGGSPSNKIYENGTFTSTETQTCRLQIKSTIDVLLEHLESLYGVKS